MPLRWNPRLDPKESISAGPLGKLFQAPFRALTFHYTGFPVCPWAWQSPKISPTNPATEVHQMLLRPHVVTWGWWEHSPLPPGNWLIFHRAEDCAYKESGGILVEWRADFGWLTNFDLEVICLALDYLMLPLPVLIILLLFLIHVSPGERSVNMWGCCFQQIHSGIHAKPGFAWKPVWHQQQEKEIGFHFL